MACLASAIVFRFSVRDDDIDSSCTSVNIMLTKYSVRSKLAYLLASLEEGVQNGIQKGSQN